MFRAVTLCYRFLPVFAVYPIFVFLLPSLSDVWYKMLLDAIHKVLWKKNGYFLISLLFQAGPTFIKLGQWAATRPDIFSPQLISHLSSLHSECPFHSFEDTVLAIEESFGKPIYEVFTEFDQVPVAAGAIAQIYRAKLGNQEVAVKVRHPNIEEIIRRDLKIIDTFSKMVSFLALHKFIFDKIGKIPGFQWLHLDENVLTFAKSMQAQVDLRIEGKNLGTFIENFHDYPNIVFPKPYLHYTHPKVLVESFEKGVPISEFTKPRVSSHVKNILATMGIDLFLKMIILDNCIHADLHPGNILVRLNGKDEPQIIILDVGLITILSNDDRRNFLDLFSAIIVGDGNKAASLMLERSRYKTDLLSGEGFKREMADLINYVMSKQLSEVEVGDVLTRIFEIGRKYKVAIESNFATLFIGTIVLEGLGKQLNPRLNFIEEAKPFLLYDKELRSAFVRSRIGQLMNELWKWSSGESGKKRDDSGGVPLDW